MDRVRKQHLKNMMIRIKLIFFLQFSVYMMAQKEIIQDLNLDGIKDTLRYKCYKVEDTIKEPVCKVEIKTGKFDRKYKFNLNFVGYPVIMSCGSGCISFFDSSEDTEYTREYNYCKKYDDWLLTKDEEFLKYKDNEMINNFDKKYLIGLSGKKYRNSKKKK